MFPPTPNSKISFRVATGPQTSNYTPESKCSNLPYPRTTSYKDQSLFDRLSGWSVDINDASGTVSEKVGIVLNMSLSSNDMLHTG
jgi:hypothetical protein